MRDFIIKNKKSVIVASILFVILHTISIVPFLHIGIVNDIWDPYIYLDTLAIFAIVLICIMLIYREFKINHIRKKTKNWVDPLKDEEKAKYKTFMNSVIYETIVSAVIYFIVASIYYFV